MKRTILVSLAGLALFLAGCTQQVPVSNQNLNQPTANLNQNTNQPVVNQNTNQSAVNVNQPVDNGNQNVNTNQNINTNQSADKDYFVNKSYGYKIKINEFGYQAFSNTYGKTSAAEAADVSIRKPSEPLDTYQGQTSKPSLDIVISNKGNRTLSEIAQTNYNLNKDAGYAKGNISDITFAKVPAKQFTVAGGFKNESGYRMTQEIFVIYLVKEEYLFQITVPANHKVLNQIMYSFEFTK